MMRESSDRRGRAHATHKNARLPLLR